jgi:transcriptional regulator with XRE-family HTH domain
MPLGDRLREERNRLDMTQEAFADACGINKRGQVRYEGDVQVPGGGYLAAAAELGIDVNYVLTGRRLNELEPVEARVLSAFRAASDEVQRIVLAALGAADRVPSTSARTVFQKAEIGQQISGDLHQKGDTTFNVGGRKKK